MGFKRPEVQILSPRPPRRSKVRFAPASFLLLADASAAKKPPSPRSLAPPFPQKAPLGSPVRLQARSQRLAVATNLLRLPRLAAREMGRGVHAAPKKRAAGRDNMACARLKNRRAGAKSALLRRLFAFDRLHLPQKAAVAPLPCSSFSAKGPARLACSLASALTTARCRYQPFAAAAPRESNRGGALAGAGLLDGQGPLARKRTGQTHRDDSRTRAGQRTRRRRAGGSDPTRPIVKIHVYGQGRRQNRAQRQLFLANNRPVCYNVDRWSTCPAPLPGCWHPLWRAYPFPPE